VIVAGVATLVPSCAGSEDCLPEDSDMLTIALSVWHGLTRWRDRYDGAHDAGYTSLDGARGVVVGGEHVYVSGYERWDGGSIATTIAYTKSGGVRDWIGRCGALTPEFGAIGYSNEVTPRVMVGGTDGASEAIAIAYPA
jgi:hypothetical protein